MINNIFVSQDYQHFIQTIKERILYARNTAVRKVNTELITLYYSIGKQIALKQQETNWGDDLIGQMELDLKQAFPDMKGFSRRNIIYMKQLYLFVGEDKKVQQLVAQIPWGHIVKIMTRVKNKDEALFYIRKTIENNWSRAVLEHQIELNLYKRQGKLVSNFEKTIQPADIELIRESFKESYILDFLQLDEPVKERDLEKALTQNIIALMLEFGKGFAFVGKQYKLTVGGQEFFVDLVFYNYILKRFIVIELKTTEFKPDYAGQIGFYITAIDRDVKTDSDNDTIGLIICKSKNTMVVEYALAKSSNPTGVAEYKLNELPEDIAQYFPTDEEIEARMQM